MTPKKIRERRERILTLDCALKKLFPDAKIELHYSTPLELLVAVQLSAQCTDKRVNKITETLFRKYKKLDDYVQASAGRRTVAEFERDIRSSGFYRNKTKNILATAKIIKEDWRGQVPSTMEDLLKLPGVGRKTATVVLKEVYGVVAGITVDTHVIRFVQRFDLSDHKDPVRIEKDLMTLLPKKEWGDFTHRVIHYGRYLAPARVYDTARDPLVKIYPPAAKKFRV
ncbi:endonuclease III [Candidatus Adlerbacteria bacterium RIFCSPHIGHO2_02_FULL_54_18]|uniref:Endonuclease III n=2 Tax=Candidatus Adleribacteriota TaxID=1752736 RepID=A0A1F4Y1S8_9BACT|nr:MAG: endonuclease III [Candidatus Adlerbacteria bacterium RIFCSPLOWO2_01_FULL_54_21b]OGC87925.1 MAG: endonuclease III [Candidatus Adlerbacteria bacterium RIFCSPHIGHO2_02_FULL_54_18]